MITSKRLDFIIPGYTRHIPSNQKENHNPPPQIKRHGHIPGYAGYIPKIKPENLYGKTFGKITYEV